MPRHPTKNSKNISRNRQTPPPTDPEQQKLDKRAEEIRKQLVKGKAAQRKKAAEGKEQRKAKKTTRENYSENKSKLRQWKDPKDRPKTPADRKNKNTPICGALRSKNFAEDPDNPGVCCQPAGWGTDHLGFGRCKFHGGNNPNGKKAAERERVAKELAEREAELMQMYGREVEIDPHTALAQEVQRTAGHVQWLGNRIREMESERDLISETMMGNTMSIWLQIYMNERDRLINVSKVAIAAGVQERTIRLAEEQGRLIATVIRDILLDKELGLTPEQRYKANHVARRHLIALDNPETRPSPAELPPAPEAS